MELPSFYCDDENKYKEALIAAERVVKKAVASCRDQDFEIAGWLTEIETDYKISQYLLLDWLKTNLRLQKILYAGSGSDILPKSVFGEEKVFHTSLENMVKGTDDKRYFPDLENGIKIIACNKALPFSNSAFDMVLFFGLGVESTMDQIKESSRVLRKNGLVVCDSIVASNINFAELLNDFEEIKVPDQFNNRGCSETNFYIFRKLNEGVLKFDE